MTQYADFDIPLTSARKHEISIRAVYAHIPDVDNVNYILIIIL